MLRTCFVDAKIFTWDYPCVDGEAPSLKEAEISFASEFRETCFQLKLVGGSYSVWPLASFLDSEVFICRYLVVAVDRKISSRWRRLLPRQAALYSAAVNAVRNSAACGKEANCCCYSLMDSVLYLLVFCEGRLTYWSEERCSDGDSLESFLQRFRCFLKTDSFFSQVEKFEELRIDSPFDKRNFRRATRDPLWKGLDLRKPRGAFHWNVSRKGLCLAAFLLMVLLYGMFSYKGNGDEFACGGCVEAAPAELSAPPVVVESAEPVERERSWKNESWATELLQSDLPSKCFLPDFRLKGIVGEKLAMVTVGAESRIVSPGDSLGDFVVGGVGRGGLRLLCGNSVEERSVGDER